MSDVDLFRIPLDAELARSERSVFGKWHRRFLGTSPTQAKALMRAHWSPTPRWVARQFSRLLRARPTAVVLCDSVPYLELTQESDTWYMPAPPTRPAVARALRKLGFGKDTDVAHLLMLFSGIRDYQPGYAGGFLGADDLMSLKSALRMGLLSSPSEPRPPPEWDEAALVYQATSGDLLLVSAAGTTAWWHQETTSVQPTGLTLRQTFA